MPNDELLEECGIEELYGRSSTLYDVGKTRRVKDRLKELHRSDPEEFYLRKKIIRQAIEERERGKKIKTMPDFTLEELKDILKAADMLYR